jgi:hypothetical protein
MAWIFFIHCFICRPSDSTVSADALELNPGLLRPRGHLVIDLIHFARTIPLLLNLIQMAVTAILKYLDFSCQPQNIDDDISGLSCFCRVQKTCGGGEK